MQLAVAARNAGTEIETGIQGAGKQEMLDLAKICLDGCGIDVKTGGSGSRFQGMVKSMGCSPRSRS
ncbi:MAG: hypothetical protein CMN77_21185 [Spirochaetaceae bacterium]|nr:hypothetical protein [Spirochaetaceae bacterium]